jgi:hypothetical protein
VVCGGGGVAWCEIMCGVVSCGMVWCKNAKAVTNKLLPQYVIRNCVATVHRWIFCTINKVNV